MMRFAVVYEAKGDFETATELADRVLIEAHSTWLDPFQLEYQREWCGANPAGDALTWTGMIRLAGAAGIKARGHFDGKKGEADARAARRALDYIFLKMRGTNAILLIRDRDDQPSRRNGLEQAREEAEENEKIPVVVGFAIVERENWIVCGFDPDGKDETARLNDERDRLNFDPRTHSHRLDHHKADDAERSPKRTLQALTLGNPERERRCWVETPLALLRERGKENGLADYLAEVRGRLALLIGPTAPAD